MLTNDELAVLNNLMYNDDLLKEYSQYCSDNGAITLREYYSKCLKVGTERILAKCR